MSTEPGIFVHAWGELLSMFKAAGGVALDPGETDPARADAGMLEAWLDAMPECRAQVRRHVFTPMTARVWLGRDDADLAEFHRAFSVWNESQRHMSNMLRCVAHMLRRLWLMEGAVHQTHEDKARQETCLEALGQVICDRVARQVPTFGCTLETRARLLAATESGASLAEGLRTLAGVGRLLRAWVPMERAEAARTAVALEGHAAWAGSSCSR